MISKFDQLFKYTVAPCSLNHGRILSIWYVRMQGQRLFNVSTTFSMLLNRYLPEISMVSETCVCTGRRSMTIQNCTTIVARPSPARPLRVGFLKVPYLVRSCFLSMQHQYRNIRNNNLLSHFYADDTQIYIAVKPHQEDIDAAVESTEQCVTGIRSWMKTNSLKLND